MVQPNPIAGSEEPTQTQVSIQQDPVMLGPTPKVTQSGDIAAEAAEDVRQQVEGTTFDEYMAGASDEDYMAMSALKAQADAGDDNAYMQMMAKLAPTAKPGETVKPFVREGKVQIPVTIEDPYKVDRATALAENKQQLDGFLMSKVQDPVVRQILVDNINMGDFSDILGERLTEQGRGLTQFGAAAIGKSPLNTAAKYAFFAWQDWTSGKTASWGAAYDSYSAQIQAESQQKLEDIAAVLPGPTLGMAVQDFVEKKLDEQLENGDLTEDQYKTILFDENGQKRRFMSDEDAQATLSYSFDQLPLTQKFGVIAVENLIGMAGFGAGRAAAGQKTLQRVNDLKEEYADLVVRGKRIGDVENPKEVVQLLEIDGKLTTNAVSNKLTRINMKNLDIGIREARLDRSLTQAADEIEGVGKKLDAMRRAGVSAKDPDYISLSNQYEAGKNRILRAKFRGRTMPLVAENVENSLVISAGQLAAREWLVGYAGMDADTAEMIGALTMGFGGFKPVKAVGSAVGSRVLRPFDLDTLSVKNSIGVAMDYIAFVGTGGAAKSLFTDDSIRRFEAATGTRLTADQLKGIRYSTRLIQNMEDDQMELVLKAADDYIDLRDRIVGSFPADMQDQASEAFTLSFAEATSLGPLAGLSRLAQGRVDARNLKNLNGTELYNIQKAQEAQITRTELALDNLEAMAGNIQDEAMKQSVIDFVTNGKASLREHRNILNKEAEQNLAYLDELEATIFDDVTVALPEDAFENLFLARRASMERLGKAFDSKAEILRLQTEFEEGFAKRMDVVAGFRGTPQHEEMLRAETESFINTHMGIFKSRGSVAYEGVVKFAEGRDPIDISPLVRQTLDRMDISDIKTFFAAEGEFFNGKLGGQAFEVMNRMVARTISPEEMTQMRGLLKQSEEFAGTPQVVDGLSDLEVALRVDEASEALNVFAQANPYEIDVMRRAFRDYAGQLAANRPELAREYRIFAKNIDTLIQTQDPEMFGVLQQARQTYQSEVGDRMRSGGFLAKLDKSRNNAELVVSQSGMQYRYTNVDPVSVFNPLTNNIGAVVAGGSRAEKAKRAIKGQLDDIMIEFGERTPNGNVFDLQNPESKANFEALSRLLRERAYADWAAETTKNLQKSAGDIRTRGIQERLGGYDFSRNRNWDDVQDAFMVDVIDENGNLTRRSLVDLDALVAQENDIEKLIATNAQAKAQFDEFATEVKNTNSQLRREVSSNVQYEQGIFDDLKDVLDTDPERFFTNIIEQGTTENFDATRDLAVAALVRAGRKPDEAAQMFDAAARSLVSRALLAKTKINPVQGATLSAVKGEKRFAREISDPASMLETIDTNREVLTAVLGEEHISYLEDIADFMNKSEPSRTYSFDGVVRPYGMNEGLSRIYNIARGMVSPLYVTSEYAVRLASQANIQMLQLAGENVEAARIITNMMKYPELVTRKDMGYLDDAIKEFVLTEITKMGADPATFFPDGEVEAPEEQEEEFDDEASFA